MHTGQGGDDRVAVVVVSPNDLDALRQPRPLGVSAHGPHVLATLNQLSNDCTSDGARRTGNKNHGYDGAPFLPATIGNIGTQPRGKSP
ncbi:hypothetical protein GCM10023318_13220 [Nocardia callitridis]|uniref:Uncharacterized protein n=1 Tax=Nocardia callitridis TaxID=648753 RepID=A0ABP9JXT9_9NOCA